MKSISMTVLAITFVALTALWGPPAQAEEGRHHFVFSITTDEAWAAGSALTQATIAAESGHDVTVLLSVRGIYLAQTTSVQGGFGVTARTPRDMLSALVRDGHTVLVCGVCLVAGGIAAEDLIEGATISGPELTFKALTTPDTVVLSY